MCVFLHDTAEDAAAGRRYGAHIFEAASEQSTACTKGSVQMIPGVASSEVPFF